MTVAKLPPPKAAQKYRVVNLYGCRPAAHSGLGRFGSVLVAGRHLDALGGLSLCCVPCLRLCFCLWRVRAVCCLALSSCFHQLRDFNCG